MVTLRATVLDAHGRPVAGLRRENFRVFEDKKEQEIATFSDEAQPLSLGLILDTSGSMAGKLHAARMAILELLDAGQPEDEFFLVTFDDHAQLVSGFTKDRGVVQTTLAQITTKGRTAQMDALYLGLSEMRRARHINRLLVMVTDYGSDNISRFDSREVQTALEESGADFYGILISRLSGESFMFGDLAGPPALRNLIDKTGGRLIAVARLDDLPKLGKQLSVEWRSRYTLGYYPTNIIRDGKWRKIRVRLRDAKTMNVYFKAGYYAPKS